MKDKTVPMMSILCVASMICYGHLLFAQPETVGLAEADKPEYKVVWVSQFPGVPSTEKVALKERFSTLVFGRKPPEVMKPFNVVAVDPNLFWILDQGLGEVISVKEGEGQQLKSIQKKGLMLTSLVGICRMPGGDLLFTDSKMNRLFRINQQECAVFAEKVTFQQPTGLAFSEATGEIWVAETALHRITVLNLKGELVKRIGHRGSGEKTFNFPTFIWIDGKGFVYIVDSMNFRIQILNSEGKYIGAFGKHGDATGFMARPKGVATDSHGNIYVSDALFHSVQIFDRNGNYLSSFGMQGQQPGAFWMPSGIYIDETDHIYVADSYNSRVQVFQLVKN